eukprot:1378512-Alexandrium_andersonii.AAC.1
MFNRAPRPRIVPATPRPFWPAFARRLNRFRIRAPVDNTLRFDQNTQLCRSIVAYSRAHAPLDRLRSIARVCHEQIVCQETRRSLRLLKGQR